MSQGGSDAYQMLPRSMLAVRTPLVILDWSTNAYHMINLSLSRPTICFTNHYHRGLGRGIDVSVAGIVCQVAGYTAWHSVENRRHTQKGSHGGGRCRKEKVFQIGHGRIAFYEHGGKTGMAMIKYPLYKKNNSRKITLAYPGLTTVSFDRIINLCNTTMF